MRHARRVPKPSVWERLDTPTKVIGAAVAALAAAVSTYLAVAGNPFSPSPADQQAQTDPAAVAARQVQRCQTAHGMRSARVTIGQPAHQLRFQRCDWPPLTDTTTDGYSEIVDSVRRIPGRSNSQAFDVVDQINAPCDEVNMTYLLAQTGGRQFVSRRLQRGRVYLVNGAVRQGRLRLSLQLLDVVPLAALRYIPDARNDRRFFVLHSGHFQPFDAVCTTRLHEP
jgi:hypothetical protein